MSRFSKAAAEAAGWSFVHKSDEEVLFSGGEQGVTRVKPSSVKAEKYVSFPGQGKSLITEEAHSMGLLLERINAYEEHLASIEPTPALIPDPGDGDAKTVTVPGRKKAISEHEYAHAATPAAIKARLGLAEREREDEKDIEPNLDPEGEASAQVFLGEGA